MTLFEQLKCVTDSNTDNIAILPAGLTYGDLFERVKKRANHLAKALQPGIPVSLSRERTIDFIVNFYALNSLGIPIVPENKDVDPEIINAITGYHVGTNGNVSIKSNANVIHKDIALVLFTSGTTDKPKPVYLSNHNLLSNCLTVAREYFKFSKGTCGLLSSPLCYILGLNMQMNMMLMSGNCLYISGSDNFNEYAEIVSSGVVNYISGVPLFYLKLINAIQLNHKDVNKLKYAFIGGASWDADLLKEIEASLGIRPYATYGLTETSPIITFGEMSFDEYLDKWTVGKPINGVEIKINSANDVLVKGPNVASYDPSLKSTKTSQWFNTGDIGELVDGNLYIVGRNKDFINKSGIKINCTVIENKVKTLDGVIECVAAGVPSKKYREDIGIAILKDEAVEKIDFEKLDRKYQPKIVLYLEKLPTLNTSGKLDRKLIKEILVAG